MKKIFVMFILTFNFLNAEIISGLNAAVGKIVNYNEGLIDNCISQFVSLHDNNPLTPIYSVYQSNGSGFSVLDIFVCAFGSLVLGLYLKASLNVVEPLGGTTFKKPLITFKKLLH